MSPVVELRELSKTYATGFWRRKTPILHGISLSVEPQQIFGFLGPNGAGKTTTIKILMGLVFATSGSAQIFGADAGDRRAKARVGYLPENPYFYDHLSVHELLDMVGRLYGLDRTTRKRRTGDLIARVGLEHAGRRPLRSFSKGMLQRAGLAQALMGDPELVVLDEPMSGLDPLGRKEVRDLILELRDRGKTVFFSTHILSDATMLCDRVAIIVRGRLRDVGRLGELLNPRVQSVEVMWEAEASVAAGLRALAGVHEEKAEGNIFRTERADAADAFVKAVIEGEGRILQVQRHRQSLEELFVSEVAAGEA